MNGPRWLLAATAIATCSPPAASDEPLVVPFVVEGDAIPAPLTARIGDPVRGKAIILDRGTGNCLICHRVPVPQEPFQGEIGPDLEHIGSRLSPGQIRLRVVDAARLNPATVMPPNHRISGLRRVSSAYAGKPVLTAQDVENVVAWLESLK